MEGLLAGRVAIVTGGGGGLGRGITEAFAAHGARVVVAEIDADRAQATVAAAGSAGGETSAMVLDVGDPGSAARLVAGALERYGRLDIVVNNVGHYLFAGSRFEETTEDQWDALDAVNLRHVLRLTRAALPVLIDQGDGGSIINVSTVEAFRGIPQHPVYSAYKAAVVAFTRSLAVDVGDPRDPGERPRARCHPLRAAALRPVADRRGPGQGAGLGAARAARRAGGHGGRRRVPRLGPRGVRHRHHDPGRRWHARRRRVVPHGAGGSWLDQPAVRRVSDERGPLVRGHRPTAMRAFGAAMMQSVNRRLWSVALAIVVPLTVAAVLPACSDGGSGGERSVVEGATATASTGTTERAIHQRAVHLRAVHLRRSGTHHRRPFDRSPPAGRTHQPAADEAGPAHHRRDLSQVGGGVGPRRGVRPEHDLPPHGDGVRQGRNAAGHHPR